MTKRILCLLLASLMLFALVACSSKQEEEETTVGGDIVLEENDINPKLAPIDGGGKTLKILTREHEVTANYWYAELSAANDDMGNAVAEKVYTRDSQIASKYNVELERKAINYNQIASTIDIQINSMLDSDEGYQIVLPMLVHAFNMASNGYCYSIDALELIDPDKPYWRGDIYNATTIKGKNYFISGDINTSVYGSSWVTFFNEEIVTANGIENPYDIVKSGAWTIDKMLELSRNFGGDGGDGIYDNTDNYAICSGTWVWQCFMYGSGLKFVDKDSEDVPFIATADASRKETIMSVLSKTVEIMNDSSLAINANKAGLSSQPSKLFCQGQVLFYLANVNNAFVKADIKDMAQEYGVLPLPKLDQNQKQYSNAVHPHHSSTIIVPRNINEDSLDLISSVLEDMAYYSYELVKPVYYNIVITHRSVRNPESYEMMEYIFENFNIDFGLIMTDTFGFDAEIRNKISTNDINFSSYLSGYTSLWQLALDDITETYGKDNG